MKVDLFHSIYSYMGMRTVDYVQTVDLPFAPFPGLFIGGYDGDLDFTVKAVSVDLDGSISCTNENEYLRVKGAEADAILAERDEHYTSIGFKRYP